MTSCDFFCSLSQGIYYGPTNVCVCDYEEGVKEFIFRWITENWTLVGTNHIYLFTTFSYSVL